MLKNQILILSFLTCCCYVFPQQTGCKVKLFEISDSYSGDCKKGLAHGRGKALGVDSYEGEFIKGLPEGDGVYTWANGNYYEGKWKNGMMEGQGKMFKGDTIITGYWKANHYQGLTQIPSYKIVLSRNVSRFTFTRSNETSNGVKIKVMLGGVENVEIEDFSIAYSSGTEYRNIAAYGVQTSSVPLDVTVRYRSWNQLHTAQYDVIFEFTLLDPGVWNVTLFNM